MSNKPLEGIKVVELSAYAAAPGTARVLSDLGSEVIKIESPTGDQWRETGKKLLNTAPYLLFRMLVIHCFRGDPVENTKTDNL